MSSAPSKEKKGEHAMCKHAQPLSTDFAWLPEEVAQTFCAIALRQDPTRHYGAFSELQVGFNETYQEFGIFSQMPAERLCRGCGVQSDDTFCPIPPRDRGGLFQATLRLMRLMLTDVPLVSLVMKDNSGGHYCHLYTTETATF